MTCVRCGLALLLVLLIGLVVLSIPRVRDLTDREEAFSLHLRDYDGLPVGTIATTDDWDFVCEAWDYTEIADLSPEVARARGDDAAMPLVFADGVDNDTVLEGTIALVFVAGRRVVDAVFVRGANLESYGACHGRSARFLWVPDEPGCADPCGPDRGHLRIVDGADPA